MRRKDREIKIGADIMDIIHKAEVCRIALTDDDQPYIVALNYGVADNNGLKFYFHCASEGRKMDIIEKNNKACIQIEVDEVVVKGTTACGFTMDFKSVIGFGRIGIVTDPQERVLGMDAIMSHYSDEKKFIYEDKIFGRTTILRMDIDEITGKKKSSSIHI
jgi:nitroimidazol reductase NimA-like FMN-containing flavoprotein (pyridoxamine 5'-phosphate oxidase superfamily)